jgi:hypothetical protein
MMNQEIERLQENIKGKEREINRLDQIARNQDKELESWKSRYQEL